MINFLFHATGRKAWPECGECEFYSSFPASGWALSLRLGAQPPAACPALGWECLLGASASRKKHNRLPVTNNLC